MDKDFLLLMLMIVNCILNSIVWSQTFCFIVLRSFRRIVCVLFYNGFCPRPILTEKCIEKSYYLSEVGYKHIVKRSPHF